MRGRRIALFSGILWTALLMSCSAPSKQEGTEGPPATIPRSLTEPSGNNPEAVSFAKAMTDLTRQTWPKSQAVWNLELIPQQLNDNLLDYRKSVTRCSATISMSDEWLRQTESEQRSFLKTALDVLHLVPALPTGPLDYYPNSSGEVSIKVADRVVAHGTYTRTRTDIHLEPGSFAQSKPSNSEFTLSVSVVNDGGRVRFQGTTSLPDSESILVTLEGRGYSGQTKVTVNGGRIVTDTFSNGGASLSPGSYSLQFNVFDPKTNLMIQAKTRLMLFEARTIDLKFKPVSLGE